MRPSIAGSIFYLIAIISCFTGLFALKKSDKPLDLFVWLPVSILSVMCVNVVAAALLSLARIPINLYSIGGVDLLLAVGLWGRIVRTRSRQRYRCTAWTAASFALVALLTALLALRQFGPDLTIHYCTMDPGVHLSFAMDIVNHQQVEGMFFAQLHNALFIELFSPFIAPAWYYKLFILSDVGMLALGGCVFTSLIHSRCTTRFMKGAGVVLTSLYLLGYPLNNLEYGFVYLGLGVTVTAFVLFIADRLVSGDVSRRLGLVLLGAGLFGVFACYILFAPVVWAGVLLLLLAALRKKGFTRRGIGELAALFAPPALLAVVWYLFHWYTASSPSSIISLEGFIFQDLFGSFLPFAPFVLYGFARLVRSRVLRASAPLFCVLGLFIAGMFTLGMLGRVSAYYYYKSYYLLWLVAFDLLVCGLATAAERSKGLVLSYSLVWAMVAGMAFSGADRAIHDYKPYFNPEPSAGAFFRLYRFNAENPSWEPMDPGALELFQYSLAHFSGETVPLVGTQEQFDWYEGISNQRLDDYQFWKLEPEEAVRRISGCRYAVVLYNNDLYRSDPAHWESFERVFENESGYVAKLR